MASHSVGSTRRTILILGPIQLGPLLNGFKIPNRSEVRGMGNTPVVNQALALQDQGHRLAVITLTDELSDHALERYEGRDVTILVGRLRRNHGIKDFCRRERQTLLTLIREIDPDLIIANYAVEYALAALESGKPSLVVLHDHAFNILKIHRFHPYWIVRFMVSLWVIVKARRVVGVSNYVASFARRLRFSAVPVICNPLQETTFHRYSERRFDDIKCGGGTMRIISVLSWSILKNPKPALAAFSLLRRSHSNTEYYMIGPGLGHGEAAEIWASKNGLSEGVIFSGVLSNEDVLTLMTSSHILLHPSLEEAVSMVILEAMAIGVPIIAGNNCAGVREVLDGGSRGCLVNSRNAKALSDSICRLLQDPTDALMKARCAHTHVLSQNHPQVFRQKVMKHLYSALS